MMQHDLHPASLSGTEMPHLEQFLFSDIDQNFSSSSSPDYDSFSSPISDAAPEIFITEQPANNGLMELVVLHKPRGSKGVWQRVENSDKLRVTKGKGKRLKLQCLLPMGFQCDNLIHGTNLKLQLLEVDSSPSHGSDTRDPDFSVETVKAFDNLVEVELKLFRMGKKLQFFIQVRSRMNEVILGKSVEFTTHNSGAVSATTNSNQQPSKYEIHSSNTNNNLHHSKSLSPPSIQQHLQQPSQQLSSQQPPIPIEHSLSQSHLNPSYPQTLHNPLHSISPPHTNPNVATAAAIVLAEKKRKMTNDPSYSHLDFNSSGIGGGGAPNNSSSIPYIPPKPVHLHGDHMKPMHPDNSMQPSSVSVVPGSLDVHGTVRAKAFMQFSDMRLKANIQDIVDAIQIVTQLQGKSYEWKSDMISADVDPENNAGGGKRVIGLIAQEVQKVVPEVVHMDPHTGFLAVSYTELLPILIEAFKSLLQDHQETKEDVQKQLLALNDKLENISKEMENNRSPSAVTLKEIKRLSVFPNHHPPSNHATVGYGKYQLTIPNPMESLRMDPKTRRKARIGFSFSLVLSVSVLIIGLVLMGVYRPHNNNGNIDRSSSNTNNVSTRMVVQMVDDGQPQQPVALSYEYKQTKEYGIRSRDSGGQLIMGSPDGGDDDDNDDEPLSLYGKRQGGGKPTTSTTRTQQTGSNTSNGKQSSSTSNPDEGWYIDWTVAFSLGDNKKTKTSTFLTSGSTSSPIPTATSTSTTTFNNGGDTTSNVPESEPDKFRPGFIVGISFTVVGFLGSVVSSVGLYFVTFV